MDSIVRSNWTMLVMLVLFILVNLPELYLLGKRWNREVRAYGQLRAIEERTEAETELYHNIMLYLDQLGAQILATVLFGMITVAVGVMIMISRIGGLIQ